MKNYCESCKIDCELRNAVTFCEDCANRLLCNEFLLCYRDELCTLQDCYIPREYPEIRECEDGCKPPKAEKIRKKQF